MKSFPLRVQPSPSRPRTLTAVAMAFGLLLASGSTFAQQAGNIDAAKTSASNPAPITATDTTPAAPAGSPGATPAATANPNDPNAAAPAIDSEELSAEELNAGMSHDLSPWGMYMAADRVVKGVMIALALASVATWTIFFAKSFELGRAKRRLRRELAGFKGSRSLKHAAEQMDDSSLSATLIGEAQEELRLSTNLREKDGIKERVALRLDRIVAASGRRMSQGTGILATIGSIAPFVGLFGTVWGIMNSFIGIAKSQTTNLAVVAPGIAEALLATAIGLVAAIPAVIIYNIFARSITGYKAQVVDASTQVLVLVSRDLDHLPASTEQRGQAPHVVKVG
ncbi:tonB-system energizer ExbB [Azomonas macrocytogenes]|uniref:Biopolymer transport protein ExbB n=1 Tax=Azomonas macrocytogenes TaxID=69962 RepID=A0A839T2R9_AZOMA|nr:tonB-system energizer ExbB [Azomonas macrocytogenes]MBB3103831.1 biopolymer transport protein ExbB [Azomonas macrocytogenes]